MDYSKTAFFWEFRETCCMHFFSISGFLITASYTKSSKSRFLAARFLRLYPAILIYSLFAILVIGPLNIEVPLSKYFSANPWENLWNTTLWSWKYNLPYAFSNNIIQGSTNGSTWTLPLELRCYLVTFAIGCMSGFTYKYLYFVITILMIWIIITNPALSFMGVDSKRSITPFLFYITGSLFWIFRHNIPLKWSVAIGLYLCDFFYTIRLSIFTSIRSL